MGDEQRGGRALHDIPVGLEKVLYTAAIDPVFREELLRDREAAIRARGLALEGSELAMLRLASEAQLAAAIAALDTSEQSLERRGFMRAVAGAVTLAAGSALASCGDAQPAGIRPSDLRVEGATRGIQPDLPGAFESGGIRPSDVRVPVLDGMPSAGVRAGDARRPDAAKKDGAK